MSKRLGTLTLDLVAKIGKFTQPITKADELAQKRFKNMRKNANKFGKTFAGVATTVVASSVAIVESQVDMAKEIQRNARQAGAGVEEFQKYAEASRHVGVESEQLADMLKDVQEKFGEFAATGGGGAADFFKDIAPKIGVTIEQFQRLSGPEALQLYKDSLDKAGVSQKQQIFYLESLSSDTSKLIPLLAQSGKGFDVYSESIMRHGGIMSKEAIAKAQVFDAVQEDLNNQLKGLKNTVAEALLPTFIELGGAFSDATGEADGFQVVGGVVHAVISTIAKVAIGAISGLNILGKTIAGIMAVASQAVRGNFTEAGQAWRAFKEDMGSYVDQTADRLNRIGSGEYQIPTNLKQQLELRNQINNSLNTNSKKTLDAINNTQKQTKAYEQQNKALKKSKILSREMSDAILYGAKQLGVNPNDLAAVISFETAGTFNTNARNPKGSATGLIQFMQYTDGTGNKNTPRRNWDYYGMSRNQFGSLLPMQQMKYVVDYLKSRKIGRGSSLGDIYDAVAGYGYKRGTKAYRQNRVWDVDKDGVVEKGEAVKGKRFRQHIKNYFPDGLAIQQKAIQDFNDSSIQLAEQQKALRLKHEKEAADEITRINMELGEKIREIESANHDPIRARELIEIEKGKAKEQIQGIKDAQTAQDQAFQRQLANLNRYKTTQKQLIKDNFQAQRDSLELERDLTTKQKELKLKAINEAEQYQLDKFNAREQYQLSKLNASHKTALQRIEDEFNYRRQMLTLNNNYSPEFKVKALDALNSQEDKARENVQIRAQAGFERQGAELNGTSQVFGLDKQLAEQKKIVDEALEAEVITKEEHNQRLIMLDKQYWANKNQLFISQGQSVVGSMTNILGTLVGKNSKAYRVMFAIEKGMAIARSVIAIQTGIAQAAANPFPMNLSAMASVATATASIISNLQAVRQPNLAGQAHSGLDYVPREGTYLLDKGEAVIKPRQNARLQSFLDKQEKGNNQPPHITVINNGEPVKVDSVQMTENDVRIIISKEVPAQIANHNSKTHKAIKQNFNTVSRRA